MNEREARQRLERDLQTSPSGVVYLEGKEDVPMLVALLGAPASEGPVCVVEGLGIVGLKEEHRGSGETAVRRLVEVAQQARYAGVYSILDGDGVPLTELAAAFDDPFGGPLFRWKAYCLENLIAQAGWPPAWGEEPQWSDVLRSYAAYVALYRLRRELEPTLRSLHLDRFQNPDGGRSLLTPREVEAKLQADQHRLTEYDVVARFRAEVASFEGVVAADLREAHALLNGKWLFRHLAPKCTGRSAEACREEWLRHVAGAGGSEELRTFWARLAALR